MKKGFQRQVMYYLTAWMAFISFISSPAPSHGQWSGILSPSRAIDWSTAGLPATFPDGETTANPWTPPKRAQCGPTLQPLGGGQDDTSQINGAIAGTLSGFTSCTPPYAVVLGGDATHPFTISGTINLFYNNSNRANITLRGGGPMATILAVTGWPGIRVGAAADATSNYAELTPTSNFAKGSNSITVSGAKPSTGLAWIGQCDTGYTANTGDGSFVYNTGTPCTGTHADNYGIFVCGDDSACSTGGGSAPTNAHYQAQEFWIQSITGSGPYTVNFASGDSLHMPNWSYNPGTATLAWQNNTYMAVGMGLEDMTLAFPYGVSGLVDFEDAYASWVKGVRFYGATTQIQNTGFIMVHRGAHDLLANNYFFAENPAMGCVGGNCYNMAFSYSYGVGAGALLPTSDLLVLNNIVEYAFTEGYGSDVGTVFAYNYYRDAQTNYANNGEFTHHPGISFSLREGNQMGESEDDSTHGSHNLDTWFRNYYSCTDAPFNGWSAAAPRGIAVGAYARFDNLIGNVIGNPFVCGSGANYEVTVAGGNPFIFAIDWSNVAGYHDTTGLTYASTMRWGNYDAKTGVPRWCGPGAPNFSSAPCNGKSEVPTDLAKFGSNATPFQNPTPGSATLPATFFLSNDRTNYVAAHANGGTGLSWWKVCDTWATFPTSCTHYATAPFPPIGPDVTGGPTSTSPGYPYANINGYAYDIPAAVAYQKLPIDRSLQVSYVVTASSWSNGIETLNVSGLPGGNTLHIMGGFQLSGVPSACNPSGAELFMTASTSTTVRYVLASNPGTSCTGTMRWPDIRQFDERVYQSDGGGTGGSGPPAPTGLTAVAH